MNSKALKTKGIKILQSYFNNEIDKKAIAEKFKNISGKTGQYFVSDTLFQKRTTRKNRALIPFSHVKNNNIPYNELETFKGGVVVEFVNNDFFYEDKLEVGKRNSVFEELKDKLGCDDNVSAIINIRGTGSSDSNEQRKALENLKKYLAEKNIKIQDALIRRKENIKYCGRGNEIWEGFVHVSIKGGQQDTIDWHKKYKIESKKVQLFNPSVEYANEKVSLDITLVLIYFALYSVSIDNRMKNWYETINDYDKYFETRLYSTGSLLSYVKNHISLNIKKDVLIDPIQFKEIKIADFAIKGRTADSLDITHQISVNKNNYIFDIKLNEILSPARPINLFWSFHLSNMMQQDFSLEEFYEHQMALVDKWKELNIIKMINTDTK